MLKKSMIVNSFIASIILLAIWFIAPFKSTKRSDNTLVVGMMSGWPPFMSINQAGEFEGFDIDVAQALAKRLGKKLIITDMGSLAPLFIALQQGKVDMVFSGLDITKKRLENLTMVQYTGESVTSLSLVFWDKIPENIKTIQDLKNYPDTQVCAEPGSSLEKFLDQCDFITKKPMASIIDIIMDLRFGKSLAALLEPRIAARLSKKNPELKTLSVPLPPELQFYGLGIALDKKNLKLADQVKNIINEMKRDSTLKKLEAKWELS